MRNILDRALLVLLILCVSSAAIAFGAVSIEFAGPFYAAGILLAICWAGKLLFSNKVSWLASPMHLPVLAFVVYAVARYFYAPVEYDARLELFHIALYTLVYFAVANRCYRQRDRVALLAALMVLAVAESVYGLWQVATHADVVLLLERPLQYRGRASGTFVCPNHLAGFLEMVIGLVLARIALDRSETDTVQQIVIRRLLNGYVIVVALVGLVATFSRGGWVAMSVGFIVLLLWGDWRESAMSARTITAGIMIMVAAVLGVVVWTTPQVWPSLNHRLHGIFAIAPGKVTGSLDPGALAGRELMWRPTLNMIGDYPIFGTGPSSWQWVYLRYRAPAFQMRPDYAHNDVLQFTAEYGVVGLILVVGIFVGFFWHAARMSRRSCTANERSIALGASVAVAAMLTHSWYDFNLHIPANALLLVIILAITAAMDHRGRREGRREMGIASRIILAVVVVVIGSWCAWIGGRAVMAHRCVAQGTDAKEVLDWDQALRSFRRAINFDPKYPEPYALIGDIYRTQSAVRAGPEHRAERQRLARQAVDAYCQSLALNPFQSVVMLQLAAAYELEEAMDKALATYHRALAVDPNNSFAYMRLGIFLRHIGDDAHAAEAFEKSWKLSQEDRTAQLHLGEIRPKR